MQNEQNDVDRLVGRNIARYRSAKGMSQADLATALSQLGGVHVHQQTINKIERGARSLKFMEGVKIAELLRVDVDDLSAGHDEATKAAWQLERLENIRRIGTELDDIAGRLGYQLVQLAVRLGIDRNKTHPEDETSTADESANYLKSQVVDILETDWGASVNERIQLAMQQHPYLAEMRSEFAAASYGEVLKRVSESPIITTEIADEELVRRLVPDIGPSLR